MTKKTSGFILIVIIIVMAIVLGIYSIVNKNNSTDTNSNSSNSQTDENKKSVTVEIIIPDQDKKVITLKTNEVMLGAALLAENIVKGDKSEYGLYITEANGRIADSSKQEWWCITKNGESVLTGVDSTPIMDKDKFELTLVIGY